MNSLDGLHRTTMFTETVNDIECEEKRALRRALQEATDKYEDQKARIRELENHIAARDEAIKDLHNLINRKPRYVFVEKDANIFNPPFGS